VDVGADVAVDAGVDVAVLVGSFAGCRLSGAACCFGAEVAVVAALPLPKYVAHSGPTLAGSFSYCSFISSTSHSLAPRSDDGATEDWLPDCPFGDCATLVSPLPGSSRKVLTTVPIQGRPQG
jgi:hypothetical protein